MEGKINALVAGPNCRTRSLLRHIPVHGNPNVPRPVRRWGGEGFDIEDATEEEQKKLHDDDILMWRCVFLYMVTVCMRRARKIDVEVVFALEQPASPHDFMPEVASRWDTSGKTLRRSFVLRKPPSPKGQWEGCRVSPPRLEGIWSFMYKAMSEGREEVRR